MSRPSNQALPSHGRKRVAPLQAGAPETPYARFLVQLMRVVVALIVAGFVVVGIRIGYDIAHENDRSTEWIGGVCASSLIDDGTCGYKPAAGAVLALSALGGTAGLLGGLVATFSIETGIVVFLAARISGRDAVASRPVPLFHADDPPRWLA